MELYKTNILISDERCDICDALLDKETAFYTICNDDGETIVDCCCPHCTVEYVSELTENIKLFK